MKPEKLDSDGGFVPGTDANYDKLLADIGVWELDLSTGQALRNRYHDRIFGYETPPAEWNADIFLTHVDPDDRERISELLRTAVAAARPWVFETRIRRTDAAIRWISASGQPILDKNGKLVRLAGHVIDITELKRNEQRLRMQAAELDHRVNNMLALMKSMIRISARNAGSVAELCDTLDTRLMALAHTNRTLGGDPPERGLAAIVAEELRPFAELRHRVQARGLTGIVLNDRAAMAVALVLHELVTAAVTHGALSTPDGTVTIDATRDRAGALKLTWRETGGPVPAAGTSPGFDTPHLQRALSGIGRITHEYGPGGLLCAVRLPAPANPSAPRPKSRRRRSATAPKRILIVEDESLIALDLAELLKSEGYQVIGPFPTVDAALPETGATLDAAVLDVNLGTGTSAPVASRLSTLGVPFLVISGYGEAHELPAEHRGAPRIAKPFADSEIFARMREITGNR